MSLVSLESEGEMLLVMLVPSWSFVYCEAVSSTREIAASSNRYVALVLQYSLKRLPRPSVNPRDSFV